MKRSDLTQEEQKNVRTALRFLRTRCGSMTNLAKALSFNECTLMDVLNRRSGTDRKNTVSASMAFRVARFVKVPVDDVVNGRYPAPGACPHCGHVPGDAWDDGEVKP